MIIKTYKGYNDTMAIEVQGELTREDFIIEETAPHFAEYTEGIDYRLRLILKDEVALAIDLALPRSRNYSYQERKELETVQTEWVRNRYFKWDYRGCRTNEQKERKKNKRMDEAILWAAKHKEEIIDKLIADANRDIESRADRLTHEYDRRVVQVMSGENMATDFKSEHLDDPKVVEELNELDIEIKRLKEERTRLHEELRVKRNENMIAYLEKEGWNDDDEGKVVIRQSLRDAMLKKYKAHEAFGSPFSPFELEFD
jgi:hypothetical protein